MDGLPVSPESNVLAFSGHHSVPPQKKHTHYLLIVCVISFPFHIEQGAWCELPSIENSVPSSTRFAGDYRGCFGKLIVNEPHFHQKAQACVSPKDRS